MPRANGYYEVVNAPVGAVINYLPDGYETIDRDGREYYQYDDVFYQPIEQNGNIAYQVVRI